MKKILAFSGSLRAEALGEDGGLLDGEAEAKVKAIGQALAEVN